MIVLLSVVVVVVILVLVLVSVLVVPKIVRDWRAEMARRRAGS